MWVCEKDMLEAMAEELSSADPESSRFFNEYMQEFIFVMTLELREDGSFVLTPDLSKAKEHVLDAFRSYLRDTLTEQGIAMTDEQIEQYAQLAAGQMAVDLEAKKGSYEVKDGMLCLEDADPVPYVLTAETLEFSVEEFGDLTFNRVG